MTPSSLSAIRSSPCTLPASLLLSLASLFTGCVSGKYLSAPKDTPPPRLLHVTFAPTALEAELNTLIIYGGPGSWKRKAFWDEYVVSVRNPGRQPLTLSVVGLADFSGTVRTAGSEPWALEKASKTLERRYKDTGVAFVRYTAPAVLIVGAGAAGVAAVGIFSSTAAILANATVVALPVYYIGVLTANHSNKIAVEKEFNRRRLVLPLTLAPGETRTGSLFFPMVPSPRSLALHWSTGPASGESVLPLDFLHGLHTAPVALPSE